jgi:hypothetical protein
MGLYSLSILIAVLLTLLLLAHHLKKYSRVAFWLIYAVWLFLAIETLLRALLACDPILYSIVAEDSASRRLYWVRGNAHRPYMYYRFDRYDPQLGWVLEPNLNLNDLWKEKYLKSNSKGIRGSREYEYSRSPDRQRILVLGDSFSFGEEVSDHESYPAQLEQALKNTEVINMGVHGYGHDQMLLYYESEGYKYQADLVLLGFLRIDMSRNMMSFRDFAKPFFQLQQDQLVLSNVPVASPAEILRTEVFRFKLLDAAAMLKHRCQTKPLWERSSAVTEKILLRLKHQVEQANARLVLFYLCDQYEALATESSSEEEHFLEFCHREGLDCLSTSSVFHQLPEAFRYFTEGGHYTAAGNNITAQALKVGLEQFLN